MPKHRQPSTSVHRPGGPTRPVAILRAFALLVLVASPTGLWPRPAAAEGPTAYGVAVTQRNFPDFTIEDVDEAVALAKQIGDYAVFIYQWGKLDVQISRLMVHKVAPGRPRTHHRSESHDPG